MGDVAEMMLAGILDEWGEYIHPSDRRGRGCQRYAGKAPKKDVYNTKNTYNGITKWLHMNRRRLNPPPNNACGDTTTTLLRVYAETVLHVRHNKQVLKEIGKGQEQFKKFTDWVLEMFPAPAFKP